MKTLTTSISSRTTAVVVAGLILIGLAAANRFASVRAASATGEVSLSASQPLVRPALVQGTDDTLVLPVSLVESMGLKSAAAKSAWSARPLRMTGRLSLDPARLVHVHSRFSGEIVRIGATGEGATARPLRVGDSVRAGQILAVLWSKEIGEKKSDLVDAKSRLAMHEALFRNLKSVEASGAVAGRAVHEMQRAYESDLIDVERLRRTLRSWRLSEAELSEIEAEGDRIHRVATRITDIGRAGSEPKDAAAVATEWAQFIVTAPFDGVVLEQNIAVGDIVGTDLDLFKIADMSRLVATANAYEDDLPALLKLPPERRQWTLRLPTDAEATPIQSEFQVVGAVIDPNQHTAVVQGWVTNDHGRWRVGQFIEATVAVEPDLSTLPTTVEVPIQAIIDRGASKHLFVADDAGLTRIRRIEAKVVRRTSDAAFVVIEPERGITPQQIVLTGGTIELSAVLDEFRSTKR